MCGFDIVVAQLKAFVDRCDAFINTFLQDDFVQKLKQYIVQLPQGHGQTIIAVHKLLHRKALIAVAIAKHFGQLTLVIEQQTLFGPDRKSTRLNSSHVAISYAVFCLKKKKKTCWNKS